MNKHEHLWTEKYRPNTIEECILPPKLQKIFTDIVKTGQLDNMILCGTAGLGKCLDYDTLLDLEVGEDVITELKKMNIDFRIID